MSPCHSADMTEFIGQEGKEFVAFRSPDSAEDDPDYEELGRFATRAKAEEFLAEYMADAPE